MIYSELIKWKGAFAVLAPFPARGSLVVARQGGLRPLDREKSRKKRY
jgi:hypothetical protein